MSAVLPLAHSTLASLKALLVRLVPQVRQAPPEQLAPQEQLERQPRSRLAQPRRSPQDQRPPSPMSAVLPQAHSTSAFLKALLVRLALLVQLQPSPSARRPLCLLALPQQSATQAHPPQPSLTSEFLKVRLALLEPPAQLGPLAQQGQQAHQG